MKTFVALLRGINVGGRSKLAAKSEKLIGVPMTDRNWNTIGQIVSMLDSR
jgi:uncharacterized protein (DUF1697 family)